MNTFLSSLKSSLLLTLVLAFVLCGVYPLAVWAGGQLLFRHKANGSLIVDADGTVRGSELLGQSFNGDRYFQSRPSAAGGGYDAGLSSGTNLGPTSQKLADAIKANVEAYRAKNKLSADTPVPADAVTASASGLDPHISPANASLQAARVAKARGLPVDRVRALIAAHTDRRFLGVFGEPGVNVLLLNRALDSLAYETTP
ncbi:K(+)-transporting ATPase subunit C [Termitidicoccus mucosus]|uniref:Potassium-transporting ATPase KdpC subunit n=1 Tax=Termitidicoccus mucosus TaxID=1184151 RepID=A0A178IEC0_9BACT|nr:ATPase [Opitutaceae bacterium TSB47]